MFRKLGFTMIELLIVIAVLGILAVAVLAAINPIEQINRGKDTGSRSDAEQLLSATDRYYASKGYYPWTIGANSDNVMTNGGGAGVVPTLTPLDGDIAVGADGSKMLSGLSAGGSSEIKASFVTRITDPTYNWLSIYNDGTSGASTYICFTPKSNSFKEEAWKRCADGTGQPNTLPVDFPAAACPVAACTAVTTAQGSALATGCMVCLP